VIRLISSIFFLLRVARTISMIFFFPCLLTAYFLLSSVPRLLSSQGRYTITGRLDLQGWKTLAGIVAAGKFIAVLFLTASCALPVSHPAQAPFFQNGYAPVNGLRMYYEIHGSDVGGVPPLVLLHGGGSTIETSFGKVLPALAKNRRIIAFEQQGHGRTADGDRPFTFEQSAEDTVALLRYLNVRKADFFGYSNGGHIALMVAMNPPAGSPGFPCASRPHKQHLKWFVHLGKIKLPSHSG
jgi:hypothetical protein